MLIGLGALQAGGIFGFMNWSEDQMLLLNNAPWTGFTSSVAFLVVFRTGQAYTRFTQAAADCYAMRAQWLDVANALFAFTQHSKEAKADIDMFKRRLVRLIGLLHACALHELSMASATAQELQNVKSDLPDIHVPDVAGSFNLEDVKLLSSTRQRVTLVQHWVQVLIVQAMKSGVLSIPPPICSRAIQQIGNGKTAFHSALKTATIPFPFPYCQTCNLLLIMHYLCTPIILQSWVSSATLSFGLSMMTVMSLWCLDYIATDLEAPFLPGPNRLDLKELQQQFLSELAVLIKPSADTPPSEVEAGGKETAKLLEFLGNLREE